MSDPGRYEHAAGGRRQIASRHVDLQGLRLIVARLGVVVCVSAACITVAGQLDDTVAVFDHRADANATATFRDRTYPDSEWLGGSATVIEDGRLWMPENATYRVLHGPMFSPVETSTYSRFFLLTLLLPRNQTSSPSARWVFCYGCAEATLGPGYQVLSDSGDGFLFARRRS